MPSAHPDLKDIHIGQRSTTSAARGLSGGFESPTARRFTNADPNAFT